MDHAMQDRKPGQITSALGELQHAAASLEDSLQALEDHVSPVRWVRPQPKDPSAKELSEQPMVAPLAAEMYAVTARLQRMESRIVTLRNEVEL